jgi:hypothetical protein
MKCNKCESTYDWQRYNITSKKAQLNDRDLWRNKNLGG